MATVQNPGIPRVKLESALDGNVKHEQMDVEMTSPYTDDGDDGLEDGGDLDFTNAQQQLWLASIPRTLWSEWSGIGLDEEIEIGTIRVEGPPDNPQRVSELCCCPISDTDDDVQISLKLNSRGASDIEHKEYNLRPLPNQQSPIERPGQALIFSEQDLPGYKAKPFAWEQVDEDGNPGQGRSQLYEKHKRDQQKKENPDRFEPYKRKPIPKKTALAGTVVRDLQAEPVKNGDYERVEEIKANMIFGASKQREKTQIFTSKAAMAGERTAGSSIMATTEQRRAANKVSLPNQFHLCMSNYRRPPKKERTGSKKVEELRCLKQILGPCCTNYSASIRLGDSENSKPKPGNQTII